MNAAIALNPNVVNGNHGSATPKNSFQFSASGDARAARDAGGCVAPALIPWTDRGSAAWIVHGSDNRAGRDDGKGDFAAAILGKSLDHRERRVGRGRDAPGSSVPGRPAGVSIIDATAAKYAGPRFHSRVLQSIIGNARDSRLPATGRPARAS